MICQKCKTQYVGNHRCDYGFFPGALIKVVCPLKRKWFFERGFDPDGPFAVTDFYPHSEIVQFEVPGFTYKFSYRMKRVELQ